MTLNQILRRIRRQPAEPKFPPGLTAEQRAWVVERNRHLDGMTSADIDEIQRRAVEGGEEEIRQALAESDAQIARRREDRNRQPS